MGNLTFQPTLAAATLSTSFMVVDFEIGQNFEHFITSCLEMVSVRTSVKICVLQDAVNPEMAFDETWPD